LHNYLIKNGCCLKFCPSEFATLTELMNFFAAFVVYLLLVKEIVFKFLQALWSFIMLPFCYQLNFMLCKVALMVIL
jgi:hypothetical protein